jgi:hypothetical protein
MKGELQNKFENFEGRHDFSDTEWRGLEQKLDARVLRRRFIWGLVASFLLLSLIGSNAGLWYQNHKLNKALATLENRTSTTEKAMTKSVIIQTDTVMKRTVIYQFDTVYRRTTAMDAPTMGSVDMRKSMQTRMDYSTKSTTGTTTVFDDKNYTNKTKLSNKGNNNAPVTPPSRNNRDFVPQQFLTENRGELNLKNKDNTLINNELSDISKSLDASNVKDKIIPLSPPQYLTKKGEEINDKSLNAPDLSKVLTTPDSSNLIESTSPKTKISDSNSIASEPTINAKQSIKNGDSIALKTPVLDSFRIVEKGDVKESEITKEHKKFKFKMLPTYVGATVGIPILSKPTNVNLNGNQYGLKVEMIATNRVRFFTDINYSISNDMKSTELLTLPGEITPPTIEPKLAFKYWEIDDIQTVSYIIGIQYELSKNDKIRPYIAVAFNGTTTLPFEVGFEYQDKITGLEMPVKVQSGQNITHLNRVYGAVGLHWNAFHKGQLSAETYFTTPLNNDKTLTPTQIGLKFGVFYLLQ